jgi:ADP-ribose pyrophosphatase YjhB (NUDIX family)
MSDDSRLYPKRPLIGVSVMVRRDDRVLLIKRGREPLLGLWAFPGGLVELGERLEDAAKREVREEAGIEIDGLEQVDLAEIVRRDPNDTVDSHYVLIVFAARHSSGEPAAGDDAAEARWVAPHEWATMKLTADTARILSRLYG